MAGLAERMLVMYAGHIVEKASAKDLYANPSHPYTLGLLKSLPRADTSKRDQRLVPIIGRPPDLLSSDLLSSPKGCPFLPRCRYAIDRCAEENPALKEISPEHEIACWIDVKTAESHEVIG
jgi:oligopeptide transport system ATP-binding protein